MTGMRSLFVLAMLSAQGAMAAENEPPQVTPQLRQRAEDLAGAASKRFSDILDDEQRVAQAEPDKSIEQRGTFAPVWEWLARSSQAYDEVVIAQLKNKDGWTVIVQRNGEATPSPAQTPAQLAQAEPQRELHGWSGLVEMVRDWLARANRSYRNEIVKPLLEPAQPGAPSELVEQPPLAPTTPAPMAPPSAAEVAKDDQAADRIKRQAQAADTDRAIHETEEKGSAEDEVRLAAEAKHKADADAKRKADEDKRLADEVEAKRKTEEAGRVADETAARRKAEDQKRIAAEAEAKRKIDEAKRVADEAEARRKADEAKRAADEAAAKRKAEEAKRTADAATADAAERKAVAEAEAATKRQGEIDAEATRRSDAASRAKQAARAEAVSPSPPTPQAPQQKAEAPSSAPANTPAPPVAKTPRAAESSSPPRSSSDEHSDVAVAPSVPEHKPTTPEPAQQATPKAREEAVTAEPAPPVVSKKKPAKGTAYASRPGKKHASVYRRKGSYAHGKHHKPRYAQAHGRKHRAYGAEVVYVERRCDCRCGRVFKPRKRRHAAWHSYASPRVYNERPYRVRPLKHRRGLTYRPGRHYIR
jgi:hypothetical protein